MSFEYEEDEYEEGYIAGRNSGFVQGMIALGLIELAILFIFALFIL